MYVCYRDETVATWGGSSLPSSEENEGGSSVSLTVGEGGLDDTREDTYTATLGIHTLYIYMW